MASTEVPKRIRQHMQIGGAQVVVATNCFRGMMVIVVIMRMRMGMTVPVVMVSVILAQQPGAQEIDQEGRRPPPQSPARN